MDLGKLLYTVQRYIDENIILSYGILKHITLLRDNIADFK